MSRPGFLPDKLFFRIGEVAELVGVRPHVLRYCEKEIPFIRPSKTASNQRRYRRKDVETLVRITELLHDQRFTIEGARKHLRTEAETSNGATHWPSHPQLRKPREIRESLLDLRKTLV